MNSVVSSNAHIQLCIRDNFGFSGHAQDPRGVPWVDEHSQLYYFLHYFCFPRSHPPKKSLSGSIESQSIVGII